MIDPVVLPWGVCSSRLDFIDHTMHGPGVDIPAMFAAVAADDQQVVDKVLERRSEMPPAAA